MKVATAILVGFLALLVVGLALPLPEPPLVGVRGSFALTEVSVVDVKSGELASDVTILVDGGVVVALMPAAEYRPNQKYITVPGEGRYVIPSLWDMHTHSLKVSPQIHHALFISNGVTAVRDLSGCLDRDDSFWACPGDRRRWNAEAAAGTRVSPRYILQSSYQTNGGNEVPGNFPDFFRLDDAAAARALVEFYAGQNVDFVKPYTELSLQQYDNLVHFASLMDMDIAGHKPLSVSLNHALESGQRSIEHGRLFLFECYADIEEFRALDDPIAQYDANFMRRLLDYQDEPGCDEKMRAMAESETWWVPTLTTLQMGAYAGNADFRGDPRLAYIPYILKKLIWFPDADSALAKGLDEDGRYVRADFFERAKLHVGRANEQGIKLMAGTDSIDSYVFSGSSLHDELQMLVDAGLSPLQALRSATIGPATFAGLERRFGSIETGKQADLLLLDGNPLADISNTRGIDSVMYNGAYYDREALLMLDGFAMTLAQSIRLNLRYIRDLLMSPLMRMQLAD